MSGSTRAELVVISAANSWDTIRMADVCLAQAVARHVPVLYVDPPISRLTASRHPELAGSIEPPRLREVAPMTTRLTPLVTPGKDRRSSTWLANVVMRRDLRRALATIRLPVRAVLSALPLHPLLGSADERISIYWAQDDFAGGTDLFGLSRSARRMRSAELKVARRADVVLCANPEVEAAWCGRGFATALTPYGCDARAYSATDRAPWPKDVARSDRPVVGFVGHLGDRIDLALLDAVASRGHPLLLVGPRHPRFDPERIESLLARPNVQWVGPKPFDELPSYLRAMHVGLLPYGDTAFNRGSFPLKTLEYLAAGRGVVATNLPAIRWLATDLITTASDPLGFADAVDRAVATPLTPELVQRRRDYAAGHSWDRRAEQLMSLMGLDGAGEDHSASDYVWTNRAESA